MNPFKILIMEPFGWLLRHLYLIVGNYGLALIIFSILVKLILLPVSMKSKKSMMKMSRLSPKMKALEAKCGDDKNKYQMAVAQLYKDENISPMSGCLWSFIPLLILFPLYYVVREPLTYIMGLSADQITLIQQTLTDLGVTLSTSSKNVYLQVVMAGHIHTYYSQISAVVPGILDMNFNFLGMNTSSMPVFNIWSSGAITWASLGVWLLPFISGGANFLATWISTKLNNTVATDADGKQDKDAAAAAASSMKTMMFLMPIMSIWIGFQVPTALNIYWITQAIVGFVQEFILTRRYRRIYDEEDAVKAAAAAEREEIEAEKERRREERRKLAEAEGITTNPNTSRRKLKNQQKALETPAVEGKLSPDERAALKARSDKPSGDPKRPYARGRAYVESRYGRGAESSAEPSPAEEISAPETPPEDDAPGEE